MAHFWSAGGFTVLLQTLWVPVAIALNGIVLWRVREMGRPTAILFVVVATIIPWIAGIVGFRVGERLARAAYFAVDSDKRELFMARVHQNLVLGWYIPGVLTVVAIGVIAAVLKSSKSKANR